MRRVRPARRRPRQSPRNEALGGAGRWGQALRSRSASASRHSALPSRRMRRRRTSGAILSALSPLARWGQRSAWSAWPTAQLSGSIALLAGAVLAKHVGAAQRLAVGAAAAGPSVPERSRSGPSSNGSGSGSPAPVAETPRRRRCACRVRLRVGYLGFAGAVRFLRGDADANCEQTAPNHSARNDRQLRSCRLDGDRRSASALRCEPQPDRRHRHRRSLRVDQTASRGSHSIPARGKPGDRAAPRPSSPTTSASVRRMGSRSPDRADSRRCRSVLARS